ncbi:lysophospholipid acyltransferase family protein [Emcibacter sp.]|uniref:lysophospholipid acyltransferase family protein n=1 Tax=Emcibacter sp. TaxID=1979954 RepID=UPI002AA9006A|nr:lysophospholipid acyltransferase family protein [Emcibacter sp.]
MLYLRSIFFNCFFWVGTPLIILIILAPLTLCRDDRPIRRVILWWANVIVWILEHIVKIRIEIRGRENIPRDKGFILCAKHMSNLDAFIAFREAPTLTALGKKELFRVPFLGLVLRKLGIIPIDRQSGTAHKVTPEVAGIIHDKKLPLLVYPEGTRTLVGERRKLKSGAWHIQAEQDIPVITLASNSGQHWMKRNFRKIPGTVIAEFHPPLPQGLDKDTFMKKMTEEIVDRSEELMQPA